MDEIEYGRLFIPVIQYNVRIFLCGGLRRQQIQYFTLNISVSVFLRSREFENQLFLLKIIRFEIVNVFGRYK